MPLVESAPCSLRFHDEGGRGVDDQFGFSFDEPPRPVRVPLHRARRPHRSGRVDHFYTTQGGELDDVLRRQGYAYEGVACLVYDGQAPGAVPLFRLWHAPSLQHSFTVVPANLREALRRPGHRNDGHACFVYATAHHPGTIPFFALHHHPTNDHLYTVDPAEGAAALAAGYGWLGVACWVFPPDGGADEGA
jgi:hypothetical protein